MAKLNIEFKENGSMEFKLDFLGHIYTQKNHAGRGWRSVLRR